MSMQLAPRLDQFRKWAYVFGMSPKAAPGQRVGYVRGDPRRSERAQRSMMDAAGIAKVYDDWALLIRQRRRGAGDVVAVSDLWVIADPTKRTVKGGMRGSLIDRRAEARTAGASILELATGRSTLDAGEADAMLTDALDVLANSRSRSKRIGRPPKDYGEHERTIMRIHWTSTKHRTNRDALAAMAADGVKASVQMATRLLGPSGRKPGTRGPRKPERIIKR